MMVRRSVFEAVGGFHPQVIAAEDDEFCLRMAGAGWALERLPLAMTLHDASMTLFSEWWQRAVRAGHAFAQVGTMHPDHFKPELRRVWVFGLLLPAIGVTGVAAFLFGYIYAGMLMLLTVSAGYAYSWIRTVAGLKGAGLPAGTAMYHGVFISLSKFPNLIGVATYHIRRLRQQDKQIIEYK